MPLTTRLAPLALMASLAFSLPAKADDLARVLGETLYVPAYSRIFSFPNRSDLLAATLTIHNVDPQNALTVERVDYHGEDGSLLKSFITEPVRLGPFGSASFLVPSNDITGGVGSNFIVTWSGDSAMLSPLAETVMVTGPGTPGPSFTSRGRVISRRAAE